MFKLTITPRIEGPLAQPGQAEALAFPRLQAAISEAVQYLELHVKAHTPVGVLGEQGGLKGSIFGEVTGSTILELKGVVGTPSPYAEPVELGTRPHAPPIAPLIRWAEVKLGKSGKEAVAAAWAVRGAIKKRGTRGQFMFAHGLAASEAELTRIFDAAGFDIAIAWDGGTA